MEGDFIYRHHVEPRVQLHVPKEETFPTPLTDTDGTRTTPTNLDVLPESRIEDYWNIYVDRNLSDSWTRFTKFTILNEKTPEDVCGPGEATYKNASNYQTWLFVACQKQFNERKSSNGPSWNRSSTMRESWETYSYRSTWQRVQRNHKKRKWNVEKSNGSRYAL